MLKTGGRALLQPSRHTCPATPVPGVCVGAGPRSESDAGDVELTTLDLHTSEHAVTAEGQPALAVH